MATAPHDYACVDQTQIASDILTCSHESFDGMICSRATVRGVGVGNDRPTSVHCEVHACPNDGCQHRKRSTPWSHENTCIQCFGGPGQLSVGNGAATRGSAA